MQALDVKLVTSRRLLSDIIFMASASRGRLGVIWMRLRIKWAGHAEHELQSHQQARRHKAVVERVYAWP